jgi:hypothetical protein
MSATTHTDTVEGHIQRLHDRISELDVQVASQHVTMSVLYGVLRGLLQGHGLIEEGQIQELLRGAAGGMPEPYRTDLVNFAGGEEVVAPPSLRVIAGGLSVDESD